jgi:hypothetical protein
MVCGRCRGDRHESLVSGFGIPAKEKEIHGAGLHFHVTDTIPRVVDVQCDDGMVAVCYTIDGSDIQDCHLG